MNLRWAQFLSFLLMFAVGNVFAARNEAPVVDLSKAAVTREAAQPSGLEIDSNEAVPSRSSNHSNETMEQRVTRLERQMSNMTEMNFASRFEKMQQELQQLQGQIEVETHELAQLKEQSRNFYQDLDQRLAKVSPETNANQEKNSAQATSKANAAAPGAQDKTKELQMYESAFNYLNKKDYDKAAAAFQDFLKNYSQSTYAVNAHFWLGEIYYLKGKSEPASKEFQTIIANYPTSPKVADAMVKIALIAIDAGNYSKAKQQLASIQKQFPGTTAAKIATLRLKEIKQR